MCIFSYRCKILFNFWVVLYFHPWKVERCIYNLTDVFANIGEAVEHFMGADEQRHTFGFGNQAQLLWTVEHNC